MNIEMIFATEKLKIDISISILTFIEDNSSEQKFRNREAIRVMFLCLKI